MRTKAPGKSFRKGISLKQILKLFPDDATAEQWFIEQRWEDGLCCPRCGSMNVQTGAKHPTMPFRCRDKVCGKFFSTKTGTVMEGSKIGYQDWVIAIFQMMTSLKSVSSMKLHRDLGITQNPPGSSRSGCGRPCRRMGHGSLDPLRSTKRISAASGAI